MRPNVKSGYSPGVDIKLHNVHHSNLFTWHTHNCLFLLRSILKHLIQSLPEHHVIQLLEACPLSAKTSSSSLGQQETEGSPVVVKEMTPVRGTPRDTPTSPSHDTKSGFSHVFVFTSHTSLQTNQSLKSWLTH